MGMFDTVIIDGLKLKAPKEIKSFIRKYNGKMPVEFQTKDLFSSLSTFFIKENGQIFEEARKSTGKKVPYKNPFEGWKDNRSFLERVYWKIKYRDNSYSLSNRLVDQVKTIRVKSKLTNTFEIYALEEVGKRYIDLSYTIKAVNGKVVSIKLNKWSIESEKDSNKRHKEDTQFKLKMEASFSKQKEFRAKWYYPILKETYNPFLFFTKLAIQYVCNKLVTSSYRWTGV